MVWFADEAKAVKRLGTTRPRPRALTVELSVKRGGDERRGSGAGSPLLWRLALAAAAIAVVFVGAWVGAAACARALFSANDRYTITRLILNDENPRVLTFLRERQGIREGANLFAFELGRVREEFLRALPAYRAMRLTRRLPDALDVEVQRRLPVARVVVRGGNELALDRDGIVFPPDTYTGNLPALFGQGPEAPAIGRALGGPSGAALQLLQVCENRQLGLQIAAVDLSNSEYLTVWARYAGVQRSIQITWPGMQRAGTESRLNLLRKLGWWVQVMQTPEGVGQTRFDGTYPDRIFVQH